MSTTQEEHVQKVGDSPTVPLLDQKLEVVVVPVSDVDRASQFYQGLGWRLDADFSHGDTWRLVQLTPPGSACSVMFGNGFTDAAPGTVKGTFLVVDDIDAARVQLAQRRVSVSDVFHFSQDLLNTRGSSRLAGRDPQGRSYFSFASFNDPDGNEWLMQEVTTRFPGRGFASDAATLTALFREAEDRHGQLEGSAPPHHWSGWYAGYVVARQRGQSAEEAIEAASRLVQSEPAEHA